jgi:chorismate mutase
MSDSQKKPMPIEEVRREIDRVDNALLDLIAKRLDLALAVRAAKSGVRVWRPSREESHVRDLAARTAGSSPVLVSKIWAELMSASLAAQGPMRLHVALEGDMLDVWTLVHDRFGASLPALSYPTASAALAAAYNEDEGVAVLPSPVGMNSWWSALCAGGAMPDMKIHAGLPRVLKGTNWPRAVAVATAELAPSGADTMLIAVTNATALSELGKPTKLKAEAGENRLYEVDGFVEDISAVQAIDPRARIIGCLPHPLKDKSAVGAKAAS